MKLAVTGKGGVGKTTVSTLLAHALKSRGRSVVVIDCDPDSNLAACMGHPHPDQIRPLVELKELIEEKMGVKPGTTGGMFRLNPFVDDIPDRYAVNLDGIRLLVAGAVKKGGAGCYCPENGLVRALIAHLMVDEQTALVLDMEAGIEHLGRGTVRSVDRLVIVTEPGRRSLETARRIQSLAHDIDLDRISVIGNKIRTPSDERLLRDLLPGFDFAGFLPDIPAIREAEAAGRPVWEVGGETEKKVGEIIVHLEQAGGADTSRKE